MKSLPLIIAHRGLTGPGAPENTIPAFQNALDLGVDMVEMDIRRTKDLKAVCIHDALIKNHAVSDLTHRELRYFLGYEVPTLEDVTQLNWGKTRLDIELKEMGYEAEIIALLKGKLKPEQFVIKSFNDKSLVKIHHLDPIVTTGLLLGKSNPEFPIQTRWQELFPEGRLKITQASFVAPHYRLLRFAFVKRMHKLGYPVYVWTINEKQRMIKHLNQGIAGLITDNPKLALETRNINYL